MNTRDWIVYVARMIADQWHSEDNPDWHGGVIAAHQIGDILSQCPKPPMLSKSARKTLCLLRDTPLTYADEIAVTITVYEDDGRIHQPHMHVNSEWHSIPLATFLYLQKHHLIQRRTDIFDGYGHFEISPLGRIVLRFHEVRQCSESKEVPE